MACMLRPLLLLAAVTVAILTLSVVACGADPPSATPIPTHTPTPTPTPTVATPLPCPEGGTRLTNEDPGGSGKYRFNPSELTFKVGQTVTLCLKAESEFHTVTVDELEIDEALDARETRNFTYTFDRAGEFRLYCIPHEALGMIGKIVVQ